MKERTFDSRTKKLLFFGCDFLVVNIGLSSELAVSESMKFISQLFDIPHDTDNASLLVDFPLGGMNFNIEFADTPKGEAAQFLFQNYKVIDIVNVSKTGRLANIGYKYQYRVQFYGTFFRLVEQGQLSPDAIFHDLFGCSRTSYMVGRIDISADISNYSVKEVADGVPNFKGRKNNIWEFDNETGEMETYYVGRKITTNIRHFVRIYNKINEIKKKRKMTLFANYLEYEKVTRIECEIRSQSCLQFGVLPGHALALPALWSIMQKVIANRSTNWKISKFIEAQLPKYVQDGTELVPVVRNHEPLSRIEYFRRWFSMGMTLYKEFGYDPVDALTHFLNTEYGFNYEILKRASLKDFEEILGPPNVRPLTIKDREDAEELGMSDPFEDHIMRPDQLPF